MKVKEYKYGLLSVVITMAGTGGFVQVLDQKYDRIIPAVIFGAICGFISWFLMNNSLALERHYKKIALSVPRGGMKKLSNEQLREMFLQKDFYYPEGKFPLFILYELNIRGENIDEYVPLLLDMMASGNISHRELAFEALTHLYPEYDKYLEGYDTRGDDKECKEKVAEMREKVMIQQL